MRYIRKMREGTWENGGQKIKASENTRFYCLIVCDLDQETIRVMREEYQLTPVFDGVDGYIHYNAPLRAYAEFVSFEKVLRDADENTGLF